jgi:hypothetical protein
LERRYFALEISFEVFTLMCYSKEDIRLEGFPTDAHLLRVEQGEHRRSVRLTFESPSLGYLTPEAGEIAERTFLMTTKAMRKRAAREARAHKKKS